MAQRRMFSPDIVESEEFLTMPISSQALYFHLAMGADDDGFIQPKLTMRLIGANDDDLRVLLGKRFILPFDSGVVVIKHWLIHNMIRADRYKPTRFQLEKSLLRIKENRAYTDNNKSIGCQNGNQPVPQVSIGKVRLGKDRVEGNTPSADTLSGDPGLNHKTHSMAPKERLVIPPTLDMVSAYCQERNNSVDPKNFMDYCGSKGWVVGKTRMVDWQAAVRTWENKEWNKKKVNSGDKIVEEILALVAEKQEWAMFTFIQRHGEEGSALATKYEKYFEVKGKFLN